MPLHVTVLMEGLANYGPQAKFRLPSDFVMPENEEQFFTLLNGWEKKETPKRIIIFCDM